MNSYKAMDLAVGKDRIEHAKALRKSKELVSKWTEPHADFEDSGTISPLDRVETVVATSLRLANVPRSHSLAPVAYLAHQFHCLLVPLPENHHPSLSDLSTQLSCTIKEFGDLMSVSAEAMADGRITPNELRNVERLALELVSDVGMFTRMLAEASKK